MRVVWSTDWRKTNEWVSKHEYVSHPSLQCINSNTKIAKMRTQAFQAILLGGGIPSNRTLFREITIWINLIQQLIWMIWKHVRMRTSFFFSLKLKHICIEMDQSSNDSQWEMCFFLRCENYQSLHCYRSNTIHPHSSRRTTPKKSRRNISTALSIFRSDGQHIRTSFSLFYSPYCAQQWMHPWIDRCSSIWWPWPGIVNANI